MREEFTALEGHAVPAFAAALERAFAFFLLLVHAALALIGIGGLIEWFVTTAPWPRIANPLFPRWVLLLEWIFFVAAGCLFVIGYVHKWPCTPRLMILAYFALAGLCAFQTWRYLDHEGRFLQMAIEYAEYLLVLTFLHRSRLMRHRFHLAPDAPEMK